MDLTTVFTGLLILLKLELGNAIASQCYSCDVIGSDQECTDNSVIQTCDQGDYGGCQTMVRAVNDQETGMVVTAIKKGCKSLSVCRSEVQTYSSSCNEPTTDGSICYYCCDSDLCNNENVLIDLFPKSTTPSSSGPMSPTDGVPVDGAGISNYPRSISTDSSTPVAGNTSPRTPDNARVPTWTVILIVVSVILVTAFCLVCLGCLIHRRKTKRANDDISNDTKVKALGDEKKPGGTSLPPEDYSSVYHEIDIEQMDSQPKPTAKASKTGPLVLEEQGGQNTSGAPKESRVTRVSNELYKHSSGNGLSERNNSFSPVLEHKAELTYENGAVVSETTEYLTPI